MVLCKPSRPTPNLEYLDIERHRTVDPGTGCILQNTLISDLLGNRASYGERECLDDLAAISIRPLDDHIMVADMGVDWRSRKYARGRVKAQPVGLGRHFKCNGVTVNVASGHGVGVENIRDCISDLGAGDCWRVIGVCHRDGECLVNTETTGVFHFDDYIIVANMFVERRSRKHARGRIKAQPVGLGRGFQCNGVAVNVVCCHSVGVGTVLGRSSDRAGNE